MPPIPPAVPGARTEIPALSKPVKLRTAQIRILKVLASVDGPLPKAVICEEVAHEFPTAAKFEQWMADPLGATDPAKRPAAEERAGYPSLLTLGYVTTFQYDIDGVAQRFYEATPAGRKAIADL